MSVVDKVVAIIEARYPEQVGTKDRPANQRYIMHSFVAAARDLADTLPEDKQDKKFAASLYKHLAYCITHEIMIDGISHAILLRNNLVELQEILKATTSRLTKELGLLIFTSAFSEAQVSFLKASNMMIPDDAADLPLSAGDPPDSLFNCGGILVRGIIDGKCVHRCYYTARSLLTTARKEIRSGNVSSYNLTRDGRKYFPAPPNWSSGTDSIEMLRKTAVRNFIKYIAVER